MLYIPKKQNIPLSQIAEAVQGELHGAPDHLIEGICPLDDQRPGCIAFTIVQGAAALSEVLSDFKLSALIIRKDIDLSEISTSVSLIATEDPLKAMMRLIPFFYEELAPQRTISDKADIDPTANIGAHVHIGAFCSIGAEVTIEEGAVIYPHVVIYPGAYIGKNAVIHSGAIIRERCRVGANCTVQNGAIIGADGFGYVPTPQGLRAVPQVGIVIMEDEVDIGANACVDRGTLGPTRIGQNSKLDNLVQLGHNVQVGRSSLLCGDVAVGGSTKIGNGVILGGAVSVADHVTIDDGVRFGGRSAAGHIRHYEKGDYAGYPALPAGEWIRIQGSMRKLPELRKRIARLERALEEKKEAEE